MSGMNSFSGKNAPGRIYNVAIVVSSFNHLITESLLKASIDVLNANGVSGEFLEIYHVPGAFEIPLTCKRIFHNKNVDGIIALGAIIKGETPHFDFVAGECASGIQKVSLEYSKPISFGVLTTDNVEQALNRAGLKYGNKGADAASALLKLLQLFDEAAV